MKKTDKIKEIIDDISKDATHIVSSPEVVKKMIDQGLPIIKKFIRYEDYIKSLFNKKRIDALRFARELPVLDETIADGVISEIFQEIRDSHILGIFSASIANAILLLEYAMRSRLFNERVKSNPKTEWSDLEKMDMDALTQNLFRLNIITHEEKNELSGFSKTFRNPYFHINIHKLTKDMIIEKLPGININTQKKVEMRNIKVSDHKFLWFAAKKIFDKSQSRDVIHYCTKWTNVLLKNPKYSI